MSDHRPMAQEEHEPLARFSVGDCLPYDCPQCFRRRMMLIEGRSACCEQCGHYSNPAAWLGPDDDDEPTIPVARVREVLAENEDAAEAHETSKSAAMRQFSEGYRFAVMAIAHALNIDLTEPK